MPARKNCGFCEASFVPHPQWDNQKYCCKTHRNYANQLRWLTNKRKELRRG